MGENTTKGWLQYHTETGCQLAKTSFAIDMLLKCEAQSCKSDSTGFSYPLLTAKKHIKVSVSAFSVQSWELSLLLRLLWWVFSCCRCFFGWIKGCICLFSSLMQPFLESSNNCVYKTASCYAQVHLASLGWHKSNMSGRLCPARLTEIKAFRGPSGGWGMTAKKNLGCGLKWWVFEHARLSANAIFIDPKKSKGLCSALSFKKIESLYCSANERRSLQCHTETGCQLVTTSFGIDMLQTRMLEMWHSGIMVANQIPLASHILHYSVKTTWESEKRQRGTHLESPNVLWVLIPLLGILTWNLASFIWNLYMEPLLNH